MYVNGPVTVQLGRKQLKKLYSFIYCYDLQNIENNIILFYG